MSKYSTIGDETFMNKIVILKASDIKTILDKKESKIIEIIGSTYVIHNMGNSSLPHSIFLRFPNDNTNRIIGLPAYLGDKFNIAGMKWISSFPRNIENGMERASAVCILNNMEDGRCEAIMDGSLISAKRTAASAALAAKTLHSNRKETVLGVVGCGRINFEIVQFIETVFPTINHIYLYDLSKERAGNFSKMIHKDGLKITILESIDEIFLNAKLISFATTAGTPYINEIKDCDKYTTILNISLRDFAPEVVELCDNVVDDIDHVLRERTSVHLAEQKLQNRDYIRCTLGDILMGAQNNRQGERPVMFSPFGLGVLDLALSNYIKQESVARKIGVYIEDFQE